jgi:hypothetical protein
MTKRSLSYILLGLIFLIYSITFIKSYQLNLNGYITYPLFDDGMISLEYGRNLSINGQFFSGNQTDPTIGFTSYLWVILLFFTTKLGSVFGVTAYQLPYLVIALNILILQSALFLTSRLLKNSNLENFRIDCFIFICISLSSASILFWTLRGMEVPLAILMVAIFSNLAVMAKEKNNNLSTTILFAIASFIVFFARPDQSLMVISVALLLFLYQKYLQSLTILIFLALGYATYRSLNNYLFGQSASNSYFLKVTETTVISRLEQWSYGLLMQLQHHWAYLVVFGIITFILLSKIKEKNYHFFLAEKFKKSFLIQLLSIIVFVKLITWAYIGGDGWEQIPFLNRFLTSILPVCIILIILIFKEIFIQRKIIFIFTLFLMLNTSYAIKIIGYDSYNDKKYSYIGYKIGKEFGDKVTILNYWYGQPSYYSSLFGAKSIDGLGKIDPIVAKSQPKLKFWPGHDRWNHDHSIGILKPDLIIGMPCPKSHDLKFDCNAVWDEITKFYGYQPHTAPEGFTVFTSPNSKIIDLNNKINLLNLVISNNLLKIN